MKIARPWAGAWICEAPGRARWPSSDLGLSLLELALSWLASRPVVSSVIAGATRPEQVKSNAGATRDDLPAQAFEHIDQLLSSEQ